MSCIFIASDVLCHPGCCQQTTNTDRLASTPTIHAAAAAAAAADHHSQARHLPSTCSHAEASLCWHVGGPDGQWRCAEGLGCVMAGAPGIHSLQGLAIAVGPQPACKRNFTAVMEVIICATHAWPEVLVQQPAGA
jgi:hypothetical protein